MSYLAAPDSRIELRDYVDNAEYQASDTTRIFLDDNDAKFFEAVQDGNLGRVKSILNDKNLSVNINAINLEGLTVLQIAVDNKRLDIVKELLEKGADLKIALLQSVFDNDLECVEVLLTTKQQATEEQVKQGDTSYTTPIILAAQKGHYEMVHLLLKHGQVIDPPHETRCAGCQECRNKSIILQSQIDFDRFRGLSSPVYMCSLYLMNKCSEDPLTRAFGLNKLLEGRAREEPELSKEYLKLSERCKRFSVDLYNECRSMREITALLNIDEQDINLSRGSKVKMENRAKVTKAFRSAVESHHKEFVAHPHTQQLLNIVVYSGLHGWRNRSVLTKFFAFIIYTLLFPCLVAIYIISPHHKISRMMTIPFVKFLSHMSQFFLFLTLLAASALRDNHIPTILEYLIFLCVLGMIAQEFVEMLRHRPRRSYFFKWWNIITTIMLSLFVMAAITWLVGFAITGGWAVVEFTALKFKAKTGHRLLLLGNSFFSLAIVASVFHLVDLCQVNSVLGPLQLSLYRMLRDVFKFLLIFFGIYLAFVMGVRNLYSYYNSVLNDISEHYEKNNNTQNFETDHPLSTFSESTQSMFWALFDKIDLDDFNTKDKTFSITQGTGKVLFALYSICAVVVALNMLIAMMTHSYDYISQDEDVQWKFSRTRLWLEFIEKGSTLPSPYNLIPNPRIIYGFFRSLISSGFKSFSRQSRDAVENNDKEPERKKVIKLLVRRYFIKQETQRKKELSTLKDIEDCKSDIIKRFRERGDMNGQLLSY